MLAAQQESASIAPGGLVAGPAAAATRARFDVALLRLPLLVLAGVLLLGSMLVPYWTITLHAPQYPKGLHIQAHVSEMTGDVFEVDGLNHYIGMMKLEDAAVLERAISQPAIIIIAVLAVLSFWLPRPWRAVARVPMIVYPVVFFLDLFAWLYYAGNSLDPHAPLSSSIKPFTPHIVGIGTIGQFSTEAAFTIGFYLSVAAALVALAVTVWDWRRSRAT
ncbi:MAG: cytochrome C [Thermomicrobiales bacterium]|nr:cytochrome C [Thermomicrobiales bacterium]